MALASLGLHLLPLLAAMVLGGCGSAAADGAGASALGTARLALLTPSGALTPFAPAYSSPGGEEPYIAVASARGRLPAAFPANTVYALRLHSGAGWSRSTRREQSASWPGLAPPG